MTIEIANRLIEFRKKKGYSQEQLAALLEVSRQSISNWESGEVTPSIEYFSKLAKIYGCTIDDLYDTSKDVDEVLNSEDSKKKCDKINVSPKGIHVESSDGDYIDVGLNGIHVTSQNNEDEDYDESISTFDHISGIISGISFLGFVVAYILLGFLGGANSWGKWWVLLILIPVPGCIIEMIKHKKFSDFPMALIVAFLYLFAGVFYSRWSPEWVLFFLIPIYHTIAGGIDSLRKSKKHKKIKDSIDVEINEK